MNEGIVIAPARLDARRAQGEMDRHQGRVQRWRDRLTPLVNQAIVDETRGQAGSRAALRKALSEALDALDSLERRHPARRPGEETNSTDGE